MNKALGILGLERGGAHWPPPPPGAVSNPSTWPFPVVFETVPGAWVENVVRGDPAMEDAFVQAAQRLAARGVAALTTTCGFTRRYQETLARQVAVPVATSSLLLLPSLLWIYPHGKIALLTYDSTCLDATLLGLADERERARVVVAGVEGGIYWKNEMAKPARPTEPAHLEAEVWDAFRKLCDAHRDLSAILFECCGFPPAAKLVRERSGLPVYDIVTLGKLMMNATEIRKPATSALRT